MAFFKPKIFVLCFIIFSYNSYAINQCINNAIVTKLIIGKPQTTNECPSDGNCIFFEYVEDENKKSGHVHNSMNLDDEGKGMAMYDILKTALLTGIRIQAWSSLNTCGFGLMYVRQGDMAYMNNEVIVESISLSN
ncbi:hypothetical protein BJP44_07335 [Candidatus Williamhamiltonella defendens]|uniref:Uncharacterized protein A n=3 Tax=root TaxID=1 RepID=B6SCU5_9CAUD|nr:hypothetical protein [Candidatus Hamiltonella defensa]YP_002308519.1 hypothetical protein A [Bacteriophage APSE-2]ACJ10168.1 hypothetical protein A [Bacteriophage APSE-2]ACQ68278.1 APSE-2 prophage: hypothetical protein A [Bacteriophage APSE-2] [Candidatus Hamiltonella defensa 5AT (Acyrthosiphon pisum)]ATW22847.1 hypothetical protein BJP44_07335 [Candidatus Hamiltonella defensa]